MRPFARKMHPLNHSLRLSEDCAINTNLPFHVAFAFSPSDEPFSINATLTQAGRTARYGPIRYFHQPSKGNVSTAEAANRDLRMKLDHGMTLVTSHWAGGTQKVRGTPTPTPPL